MEYTLENLPSQFIIRKVTIAEVIEAIDKNGFELLRMQWIGTGSYGEVNGGCVLGQGAVNLKVVPTDDFVDRVIENWFEGDESRADEHNFDDLRYFLKDYTLDAQLDTIPAPRNKWSADVEGSSASVIIHWNDAKHGSYGEYVLKTQEEITAMAKEVLEPNKDKVIQLLAYEWKMPVDANMYYNQGTK
jgi:hypothetical protein